MKLHYTKILLFFFPLNILLTSYHAHNKNKPSITPHHTRSTTSRLLSEYDTESSIYDSDEEINSVKEIFERQTSRRFEEYEELLDYLVRLLLNIWKPAAITAAIDKALELKAANILAVGVEAGEVIGKELVITGLKRMGISTLDNKLLESYFATTSYKKVASIAQAVYQQHFEKCEFGSLKQGFIPVGDPVSQPRQYISTEEVIQRTVQTMVSDAEGPANAAAKIAEATEIATIKAAEEKTIETASTQLYSAIGYSNPCHINYSFNYVDNIFDFTLSTKKKMKKKAQYTKLLNE
ncbi:PIR protein, putative [Plasmodium sp.]|nr:PIR protein, putative [Plasmodium sp.]